MQIVKILDGSGVLNVTAEQGEIALGGRVDLTANATLNLTLGVDADGFYVDTDGPANDDGEPLPELWIDNLQVAGVQAGGRFGSLEVVVDEGQLQLDSCRLYFVSGIGFTNVAIVFT